MTIFEFGSHDDRPLWGFACWGKGLASLPYNWMAYRLDNNRAGWVQFTVRIRIWRLLLGVYLPIKRLPEGSR